MDGRSGSLFLPDLQGSCCSCLEILFREVDLLRSYNVIHIYKLYRVPMVLYMIPDGHTRLAFQK